MTPKEVSEELRRVQKKYAEVVTETFQLRISDMARDAANAIDSLSAFTDLINSLPSCNDCANRDCGFRPELGKTVRYNCPLFLEGEVFDGAQLHLW